MTILDNKTNRELVQSMLAESAKAKNEIDCANRDIQKATSRLNFLLVLLNALLNRKVD